MLGENVKRTTEPRRVKLQFGSSSGDSGLRGFHCIFLMRVHEWGFRAHAHVHTHTHAQHYAAICRQAAQRPIPIQASAQVRDRHDQEVYTPSAQCTHSRAHNTVCVGLAFGWRVCACSPFAYIRQYTPACI